jgi:sugar/nucleoside kinase (ribokinase family)
MNGLFVGLTTCDQVYRIEDFIERNHKHYATEFAIYAGGPATNAAVTYGALGGHPTLITAVGRNPLSKLIHSDILRFVPDMIDIMHNETISPPVATVLVSRSNGDRTIVTTMPETRHVRVPANLEGIVKKADSVLVDGFYMDVALQAAAHAKRLGKTVILDGGSWKPGMDGLLRLIDVAIVSERFVVPDKTDVLEAVSEFGVRHGAITRGQRAITVKLPEGYCELPVEQISAVDTLAAGDVLHGAFSYFWDQGDHFVDALRKASAVATFSCRFFGAREWVDRIGGQSKVPT